MLRFLPRHIILLLVIVGFVCFAAHQVQAQSAGFNSSYAVFSANGGGDAYYCMFSNTPCGINPNLNGANLGTFTLSVNTLVLKGAEHNVYKCGGADITATNLNYRIYKTGDTPSSFIATGIGYFSEFTNGCGGNDQQWKDLTKNINVLVGLTAGNYTIEIYSDAATTVGTQYLSNLSANYKATFTVTCPTLTAAAPPAIVSSQSTCTGCALSGGVIAPPATACPAGSTLQYSTNGGSSWTTTLPTYNQTTPITVLTRCACITDNNVTSPTSSVTTVPGVCTPPNTTISGSSTYCPGGNTTLSVPVQSGANYCWQNTGSGTWQTVGSAGFAPGQTWYHSLAFSGNTPYVAYMDGGNAQKATVMRYNGAAWENVGSAGFSAGVASYTSLAFNGSTPYVAYEDYGNSNKTTVMRYNGAAWENVGSAGFSASDASYQSLAFEGSTPYVAFQDNANGSKATVMRYNGSTWETVGSAGFSAGGTTSLSLAFNGSTPYVAYRDNANGFKATVMRYNGSTWETVGSAGFSASWANDLSLAFSGSTPYVAYQDYGNGNRTTVMRYNGANWEAVGSVGFSAGWAEFQSLAFNGSTPYVAYQDYGNGQKTTVMRYNGTAWENVGSAGFSAGGALYQSLAFEGSTPYVAYADYGNGGKTTVMKFDVPCIGSNNSVTVNTPGTYSVVVTTPNGCTATATPVTVAEQICCPTLTAAAPPRHSKQPKYLYRLCP